MWIPTLLHKKLYKPWYRNWPNNKCETSIQNNYQFCKIRWQNKVYSSFLSIYINPVINLGCMGRIVWVVLNSLSISEVRVVYKLGLVKNSFTKLGTNRPNISAWVASQGFRTGWWNLHRDHQSKLMNFPKSWVIL